MIVSTYIFLLRLLTSVSLILLVHTQSAFSQGCIGTHESIEGIVRIEKRRHPTGRIMSAYILKLAKASCIVDDEGKEHLKQREVHIAPGEANDLSAHVGKRVWVAGDPPFEANTVYHFRELVIINAEVVPTHIRLSNCEGMSAPVKDARSIDTGVVKIGSGANACIFHVESGAGKYILDRCSLNSSCRVNATIHPETGTILAVHAVEALSDSKPQRDAERSADGPCDMALLAKRYEQAERCWRVSAEAGSLESQFNLGRFYYQGNGGAPDKKRAAAWFTTAADRGHVGSQSFLGLIYLKGEGVQKSPDVAIMWLEKAARGGDLSSAQNLAFHFKQGEMLPRDLARSLQWCQYYVDREKHENLPQDFKNGCESWTNKP